ncbi:MAG: toll/interleukin-1 receptor domain-containing protein [Terrimicrobiaceae bacterium]
MNSSAPVAPSAASSGDFWRKIERFLKARTLVPVLGPGVITSGESDELFYPWLTAQVASRLGLDPAPASMHELVCAHLRDNGRVEDVCIEIDDLLDSAAIEPGPLLKTLASVAQCRLFLTLGFDPLMERALNLLRGAGRPITRTWCFSLDRESVDLPNPAGSRALLGYLFGKASPNPGYLLWEADAIEFVWQLLRQLPALNMLGRALSESNLLILGTSLPDWLVRFLLRAIRQRPFTEGSGRNFLLAGCEPSQADAVVFYESLRRGIHVLPVEPLDFTREFCRRAHAQEPPLTSGVVPGTNLAIPLMEPVMPGGSIFVSYSHAHGDAAAAFRIVGKLRAAGCLVWLDDDRLICGDDFESNLEDAVCRHCGFFISVISRTTEGRSESYYHKERNWAAQRVQSMTHARPFYFPLVIDDTPVPPRFEPRAFAHIDAERAAGGEISDALVTRIFELQQRLLNPGARTDRPLQ